MNTDYSYKFEVSDPTLEQDQSSYIPPPKCWSWNFRFRSRSIQLLILGLVIATLVFTVASFSLYASQNCNREHDGGRGAGAQPFAAAGAMGLSDWTTAAAEGGGQVPTTSPTPMPDPPYVASTTPSTSGHKYAFSTNKTNWFQALQRCRVLSMELLSIETEKENDFLVIYTRTVSEAYAKTDRDWWTSGTNQYSSDSAVFYWASNGKRMDFKFWHPGMPNQPSTQNCVEVTSSEGFNGLSKGEFRWNDYECYQQSRFVCEYPDREPSDGYIQL